MIRQERSNVGTHGQRSLDATVFRAEQLECREVA